MAVSPDMAFRDGDVVTLEATVRFGARPDQPDVGLTFPVIGLIFIPRQAITAVRPVVSAGDLVEHTLSGREGVVRHVHEDLAWVAWSDRNSMNTVTPVSDLIRKRTAAEMAALAEPEVLPAPMPIAVAEVQGEEQESSNAAL